MSPQPRLHQDKLDLSEVSLERSFQ